MSNELLPTSLKEMLAGPYQLGILMAPECSGKSVYIANHLIPNGYNRLCIDEIFDGIMTDKKTIAQVVLKTGEQKKNKFIINHTLVDNTLQVMAMAQAISTAENLISQQKKVVFDGIFAQPEIRSFLIGSLKEKIQGKVVGYWIDTPLEICLQRLQKRGKNNPNSLRELTPSNVQRSFSNFVPPRLSEGFDLIVRIPTMV